MSHAREYPWWDEKDRLDSEKRPPIPWHKAPEGTTHALWSDAIEWYFWKVTPNGTTYHDINNIGHWHRHVDQEYSQLKLKNLLRADRAVRWPEHDTHPNTQDEKGYTPMNLNNAALLVRDDITTIQVTFNDGSDWTYILHNSIKVDINDRVLVPAKKTLNVGVVTQIDQEPQLNVNSNTHYKWIICNIEPCVTAVEYEEQTTHAIAKALKQKQAASVRDQILQQFGVTNHQELMALGRDNAQSE